MLLEKLVLTIIGPFGSCLAYFVTYHIGLEELRYEPVK